jgi:hypothetical protein
MSSRSRIFLRALVLALPAFAAAQALGRCGTAHAQAAVLRGVVYDSGQAKPLAHARISLMGTQYAAVTDSDGRFTMEAMDGRYMVKMEHPRLTELAYPLPPQFVELERGETTDVQLVVPSPWGVVAIVCPPDSDGRVAGDTTVTTLVGVVRDAAGRPVPDAKVRVAWRRWAILNQQSVRGGDHVPGVATPPVVVKHDDEHIEVTTGELGAWRVCGLPRQANVIVSASVDGRSTQEERFYMLRGEVMHTAPELRIGRP